jgi:hypothetical protein
MARDFRIVRCNDKDNICLKLSGDFDGSSAAELVNALQPYISTRQKVLVETNALRKIYPFGIVALERMYCHINSPGLIWTGKYAAELSSANEDRI